MKLTIISSCLLIAATSCNASESKSEVKSPNDSVTVKTDTLGATRGMKGEEVENSGGAPGPGVITDTLGNK